MSRALQLPPIMFFEELRLEQDAVFVNGLSSPASVGAWAFWIPAFRAKILHAVGGYGHCLAASTPPREALLNGTYKVPDGGRYGTEDWIAALSKDVLQRAAENYISASRLHAAGLGPAARGICVIRDFKAWYAPGPNHSAGIVVDDLNHYPRKWRKITAQHMLDAGVQPDRIHSSIRQPIRGWVSDLNSVVGVMPIDAEQEVEQLTSALRNFLKSRQEAS